VNGLDAAPGTPGSDGDGWDSAGAGAGSFVLGSERGVVVVGAGEM
jgi:hypothetical protein